MKHTKETKDKMQVVCYEYKKPRHFKLECPNLQKEEEKEKEKPFIKKTKSFMASWEDVDLSSSEDEDDEVSLCLMADTTSKDEDDEEPIKNFFQITLSLEYNELKIKFSKLTKDFKSLEKENSILKKQNKKLKEKKTNDLSKVNTYEVTKLKKVIDLRQSRAKFVNGIEILNKLLKYSKSPHDKSVLGFEKEKEIKEKPNIHCSNYRKFGCRSHDYRKHPKGSSKPSSTNPKGPKKFWVPKSMIIPNAYETPIMVPRQKVFTSHDGRRTLGQRNEDELPSVVIRK
ncbi:hypothetical protein CR513_30125, partial [Mucuna pruriens]